MKWIIILMFGVVLAQSDWQLAAELEPGGQVLAVSADGRYVAANSFLAPLTVWDLQQGEIVALFEGHVLEGTDFTLVDKAVFFEDGWLISVASSQDLSLDTALLAQNMFTGQRLALAGGNCDAVVAVTAGFVASCNQQVSYWQFAEDSFVEAMRADYWLTELIFDEMGQELHGLTLDPMAEVALVTLNFPALEQIRSLEGAFVALLGIDAERNLIAQAWSEEGDRVLLGRITPLGMVSPVLELASAPYVHKLLLSSDAQFIIGFEEELPQVLRLADGALLGDPAGVPFSENISLFWHPQGILSWTRAATYYHDLLRLWQPQASALVTNLKAYQVIYSERDWQTFLPQEFEVLSLPYHHTDPEKLLLGLFRQFEARQGLEFELSERGPNDLVATVTLPVYDDSVAAYRYELGLRKLELHYASVWALWEARYQWQCARGELAGVWTTEICP